MPNLLTTIQSIAVNAVNSTNPITFTFGVVTNESPLRIRIEQNTINLEGDSLILTANVIEKTIEIDKHTHAYDANTLAHTHAIVKQPVTTGEPPGPVVPVGTCTGTTVSSADMGQQVMDTVLSARCIEHGETREGEVATDQSKIVITVTRKLKKGDKVVMLRVSGGQRFIVLSRVYE